MIFNKNTRVQKVMVVRLILNTPDLSIEGNTFKQTIDLTIEDYQGKSVKEIVSTYVFRDVLEGQDEEVIEQALELMFNFIQPVGVKDLTNWWDQPFANLIAPKANEITLDLEFSEEGIAFINQMM